MNKALKTAAAAGCALTLMLGSALAGSAVTTRTLQAQYMGIRLEVNGQPVEVTDSAGNLAEPFVIDGTTYVPVRALGEALGKRVEWDPETNTVRVGLAPLAEDALQLIDILEQTHPAFALDAVPVGYEAAKAAFLAKAEEASTTLAEFTQAAMAYTAALGDSHTRIDPFGGMAQLQLEADWYADGDRLILAEGGVVTAVGGLPVEELFARIDQIVPAENQAGRNANRANWSKIFNILALFGAQYQEDGSVILTLADGQTQAVPASYPAQENEPVITAEQMGDVFYVDFNQCVLGAEVDAVCQALSQAVQGGVHKVILDVRGNGGGNSAACTQLLEAMGMEPPDFGAYVRYSPLAMGTYPQVYTQDSGGERFEPDLSCAKANPEIQLVVLTDEDTFSSANMLAIYVRDGGLGTLIGRPSSNQPNHYGDILFFQLENTGLGVYTSHKQWLRPDQTDPSDTLTPDIQTAPGEDALAAALAFLENVTD